MRSPQPGRLERDLGGALVVVFVAVLGAALALVLS